MPYARTSDGIKIYYEEHGRAGTPLVLAYGIGGSVEMWDVNVAGLSAAHRLVLWEPRGHARSDSPEDPARVSFARWALDLRDLLDHLRLRHAHVGGLSLGAGIATRFTLRFPGRVRSLLVTNSSSAVGLPLSVGNLVMRAQSIKITLEQGLGRVLRGVPAAVADRLRQRVARAAGDGSHHRPAAEDPRARPAHRRRSRPLARADEGDAAQDPRRPAGRALAGEPLRQP